MVLTGRQLEQFSKALRDAFTPARLRLFLRYRLDKSLDDISLGENYEVIAFDVVEAAQREGWAVLLLSAARESVPGNAALLAFAQSVGLAPAGTPGRPELERMIVSTNSYLDVDKWSTRLGEIERRVCRVEVGGAGFGTGFLLGPAVVMTNHHVLGPLLVDNTVQPDKVVLRFDYKLLPDGTTLNLGTTYGLAAQDWLIDCSPPSAWDTRPEPKEGLPQPDELDYALLRLDRPVGDETVGASAEPGAPPRGWLEVPAGAYDFAPNSALFIVQHPLAAPLKLALDTNAVIGRNANGTRVTYRTNTEPGSSGSPVFNSNWDLVALHHSGDPGFVPAYNEGIPIGAISKLLESRNLRGVLGAG